MALNRRSRDPGIEQINLLTRIEAQRAASVDPADSERHSDRMNFAGA